MIIFMMLKEIFIKQLYLIHTIKAYKDIYAWINNSTYKINNIEELIQDIKKILIKIIWFAFVCE